MNWNNISDEELDRLFKASAENFDPPFDPEAWEAMDQKLEQAQPRVRRFKYSILLLCLVAFISLFTFHQLNNSDSELVSNNGIQKESSTQPEFLGQNEENSLKTESIIRQKRSKAVTANDTIEAKSSGLDASATKKQVGSSAKRLRQLVPSVSRDSIVSRSAVERNQRKLRSQPKLRLGASIRNKDQVLRSTGLEVESENSNEFSLLEPRSGLGNSLDIVLVPEVMEAVFLVVPQVDSLKQVEEGQLDKLERPAFLSSIQVAIAFAPDLTTVKFKDPEAVSANAGLLVGILLTRRLSLVSGVVWANKVYSARAEDYSFNNGYTYTAPVDATCRVLDIPVNLRYRVLEAGRNSLAVQAGLSSYIMLHEEYSSGTSGYGSYPYYKEVSNKNQHWFSVQNVSLVYTRTLSPVFSLGVEPFMKIPYSGIGDGKVKLTSVGVFFSVGYTIKR